MACERDHSAFIVGENIVKEALRPFVMVCVVFSIIWSPEFVLFCESRFESVLRELLMEVGFVTTPIACMNADNLSQEL